MHHLLLMKLSSLQLKGRPESGALRFHHVLLSMLLASHPTWSSLALFSTLWFKSRSLWVNFVSLSLIPKEDAAKSPSEFRLINLIHNCLKIYTKVLANRLQLFLDKLIDLAWTAYVKGRSILDNFLCTNKILHHPRKTKVDGVICKLEFSKAFDCALPSFLIDIMSHRGFPSKWSGWVWNVLYPSKVAISINGKISDWIYYRHRIKQRDPLSPFVPPGSRPSLLYAQPCILSLPLGGIRKSLDLWRY